MATYYSEKQQTVIVVMPRENTRRRIERPRLTFKQTTKMLFVGVMTAGWRDARVAFDDGCDQLAVWLSDTMEEAIEAVQERLSGLRARFAES